MQESDTEEPLLLLNFMQDPNETLEIQSLWF